MKKVPICTFIAGNGYIPTSSLREILAALDDQLTNDQLNEMIAEIDTDSSGTVDFEGQFCYSRISILQMISRNIYYSKTSLFYIIILKHHFR